MWSQPGAGKNTASQNNKRGPKAWKVPRKVTVIKGVGNSSRIKAPGRIAGRNSKAGAGMSEKQGQCGGPEVKATRKLSWADSPLTFPLASGLRAVREMKDTKEEAKAEA